MAEQQHPPCTITPLIEGYLQFKQRHFGEDKSHFIELVENGQQPKVLVIACCDSRIDPAIITGCQPGDLFVVRNVANLVPPFKSDPRHHGTSAAIEFAVCHLKVSDIIILGHSHCGGIRALMDNAFEKRENTDNIPSDFIHAWMEIAKPAKRSVLQHYADVNAEQQAHHCEQASLLISLDNLRSFPWIKDRVNKQALSLHAWYFDLAMGEIETYDMVKAQFVPLA